MLKVRPARERGHFDHGWLDTWHTFSFGGYQDDRHMGFRSLRVINDDRVAPGEGFGMHGHRDMEIVTYLVAGQLEHKDTLGGGAVLGPGEVQRITAGRGVRHSEFNPSATQEVHLYQLWFLPRAPGLEPGYEQKPFERGPAETGWQRLVHPQGEAGAVRIEADVVIDRTFLAAGQSRSRPIEPGRHAWLQVIRGDLTLGGHSLGAGDGVAISGEPTLELAATSDAELLLFDMA